MMGTAASRVMAGSVGGCTGKLSCWRAAAARSGAGYHDPAGTAGRGPPDFARAPAWAPTIGARSRSALVSSPRTIGGQLQDRSRMAASRGLRRPAAWI